MSTILHAGTTFLVSDESGQVASGTDGLYSSSTKLRSSFLGLDHDGFGPSARKLAPING